MTRLEALNAAVETAGSQSQFARDLDVHQPMVWRWLNQSKQLPAEYVLTAERLYGVSRHDLRPDIYPRPTMLSEGTADRLTWTDQHAGERFTGVDRHSANRPENRDAA